MKRRTRQGQKNKGQVSSPTSLNELCAQFHITPDSWDAVIIGDGSGTTWKKEMGWGSVLILREDIQRHMFHGGMSHGTNNMAEIMAVLHPLMFLTHQVDSVRDKGFCVHVLSDSQYVVNGLKQSNPVWATQLDSNRELWLAIHGTLRRGLTVTPHHIPRDTVDLNRLGHDLANLARRQQICTADELKWDPQDTLPG